MNCPDWRPLLAHRFDPTLATPDAWCRAEEHLRGCAMCRRAATAIDPTLAFRDAARWAPPTAEIADIHRAVRTLRRASEVERRAGAGKQSAPSRARGVSRRERGPLAAAALFALVLALQPASVSRNTGDAPATPEPAAAGRLLRAARPAAPAIEGVDRPDARVYEWGADDLSVVMVVDESLDV